ncbi:ABC-F family ATP-binding cassette domain-containing protein [Pelistega suis]|uniref:ABC-F family ATP-binding cassette domain-containing protein n=1 Tax=Pelistega suis TaxID=1631957 RepID=UPI00211C7BE1|nr:ATP-binding cassette domain-containing protein [Pelistega suis]MCQ9328818.1 ATP-binding cassette domain-containing protein [Pelistega suis]
MIRASGLTLRRGTKVLLDNTEFVVHPGERVGIVGKNGAGKSSLFALLLGEIDQDAGELDIPQAWRLSHVKQDTLVGAQSAREFVIDGDTHLRHLQAQRAATSDEDGQRIAELESELTEAGHWTAHSRAEQLLAGLGFTPEQWEQSIESFSGGWQVRLALARALMKPSDLLLLDEPTNHLDLDAMLWLEKWLQHYPGTVILISHDTEFLNAVARTILNFEAQKLIRYKGDYDSFLTQKAERIRQQQVAIDRQARETQRLQSFIDRFKAKATKAKQAQSRVKALARMQVLAPIKAEHSIDIKIPDPLNMPDPLMVMDKLSVGYGDKAILKNITLMLRGGGRIGVLGVNGAGKSTLIKTIAQELQPLAGDFRPSKGLSIGYFAQHQLDMLDMQATPLMHLQRIADPNIREQELRNYLGMFGFSGDVVNSPITPFSGGEKARLALSLVVWQKPNLLLLDEPSNHLDVETREALATALAEFEGSVLMVSHDRHLLRTTVDSFWIVADGTVAEFDGDLEDYQQWLANRQQQQKREERDERSQQQSDNSINRKEQKRFEAEERQRKAALRKPLEKRLAIVEAQVEKNQMRIAEIDGFIADESFYSDERRDERVKLLEEHGTLTRETQALEEEWMTLLEQIEEING